MIQDEQTRVRLVLRRRAMDLLARREHTRHELSNKLSVISGKIDCELESDALPQLVQEVLDKLELDKLLSDARFAESYVNARMNRGYGPLYIQHQLRQKKVENEGIENNLAQFGQEQWLEQLDSLIRRRTSGTGFPVRGSKEYLKLQRLVLSRGYTTSQWRDVEQRFKSS